MHKSLIRKTPKDVTAFMVTNGISLVGVNVNKGDIVIIRATKGIHAGEFGVQYQHPMVNSKAFTYSYDDGRNYTKDLRLLYKNELKLVDKDMLRKR